jgi:hypothetical protein
MDTIKVGECVVTIKCLGGTFKMVLETTKFCNIEIDAYDPITDHLGRPIHMQPKEFPKVKIEFELKKGLVTQKPKKKGKTKNG